MYIRLQLETLKPVWFQESKDTRNGILHTIIILQIIVIFKLQTLYKSIHIIKSLIVSVLYF